MFRCFKEFILNWILLACLCCIFCPVVIIFPNRFCSQLNLQGTAELGEPPSTLPTVSHTKYRLMNAQDIWESSHNPTAYMQLKTLNCPSVQIMCLCPVMNWQTCPGCSPCLHTLCTEDMLQEIPAAPLGWMDRSAFNASMPLMLFLSTGRNQPHRPVSEEEEESDTERVGRLHGPNMAKLLQWLLICHCTH